ncbi:MAG: hypothetical protein ACFCVE_10535 [Phycisphaerae bacterium]
MCSAFFVGVIASCGVTQAGSFGVPTVLFSTVGTSDTSLVPGTQGERFTVLRSPNASPDGSRWAFSADTNGPTATDDVVVAVGPGSAGVVVREGTAGSTLFPGLNPPVLGNAGTFSTEVSINDAGDVAFRSQIGSNRTIGKFDAGTGTYELVARDTRDIPPFPGLPLTNAEWGGSLSFPKVLNDGRVAFRGQVFADEFAPNSNRIFLFAGNDNPVVEAGVTQVTTSSGSQTVTLISSQDVGFAADGTPVYRGNVPTSIDEAIVRGDSVVLQRLDTLIGDPLARPVQSFFDLDVAADGTALFSGSFDVAGLPDYVARDNVAVALTGEPIFAGASERFSQDTGFSSTFFFNVGNAVGDYVVGGVTDSADTSANGVLVLNGLLEVLREGDAVDLDGNGRFDDNAFVNLLSGDGFLTDDGLLVVRTSLRNDTGGFLGNAFISVVVPEPTSMTLLAAALPALIRRRR